MEKNGFPDCFTLIFLILYIGMIVLDPSATEELIDAHNRAEAGEQFKPGSSKHPVSGLNSTNLTSHDDAYEKARQKLLEEDDDDELFR